MLIPPYNRIKPVLVVLGSVFPGLLLSIFYVNIAWIPLLLLLLYVSTLFFIRSSVKANHVKHSLSGIIFLALPMAYFSIQYTWISLLLLSLIALVICSSTLFQSYNLEGIYAVIELFILIVFINSFSFYTQTHFIPLELTLFLILVSIASLILRYALITRLNRQSSINTKKESH